MPTPRLARGSAKQSAAGGTGCPTLRTAARRWATSPGGKMVDLSVIVVTYNTRELLAACLDSVYQANYAGSLEVLVVDNDSGDGSAEMVAMQYPDIRLLHNSANRGFATANNHALALARGQTILLLNSDAALTPTCLVELQAAFEAHPAAGILGPALLNDDHSRQPSWGDFPSVWQEFLFQSFLFKLWPARFPYGRRVSA